MLQPFDFQTEITYRENLIEQLTESLQQSMQMREQLQAQSSKLTGEVMQLRKQLADTMDMVKKPHWMRDQESCGGGQRISEFSIDLVSESENEDVAGGGNLTDVDDKSVHNRERHQSVEIFDLGQSEKLTASKQIEQFQKYLSPDEMRIFFMVQSKFNDFLNQEVDKVKLKTDTEVKVLADQLETEKHDKTTEVNFWISILNSFNNYHSF